MNLGDLAFVFKDPCPALTAVQLLIDEGDDPILDTIPWPQMTNLDLLLLPSARCPVEIVSMCPDLRILHFEYDLIFHDINVHPRTFAGFVTSNIESLTIGMDPESDFRFSWAPFFDQVTLPRLSSLTVFSDHVSHPRFEIEDPTPLLDCISRSSSPVTSLTLQYRNLSNEHTYQLLQLVPELEDLTVWESRIHPATLSYARERTAQLFNCLLHDVHSSPKTDKTPRFLPRLRNISLAIPAGDLDVEAFSTAIASRWLPDLDVASRVGVDCIRSVTIEFLNHARGASLPEIGKLVQLREAGLVVNLRPIDRPIH
ncbi:hypothetical protein V5O48_015627 [Marasmius crinis-equi]|uniref:Uncharacterized protein n=1 Tax=Marasmius crinis-equi TaxID=585013 RepID=A0ABR3EUD1_9AGAR